MPPHNPWRAFRELTDWTLKWRRLPAGVWAETCFETHTVTMTLGLNQAERRCTIAHETQHILRGPAPEGMEEREEEVVDRIAARLLLPDVRAVGDALAWSPDLYVAASELWVDEFILGSRLRHLHASERAFLKRRLSDHDAVVTSHGAPHGAASAPTPSGQTRPSEGNSGPDLHECPSEPICQCAARAPQTDYESSALTD